MIDTHNSIASAPHPYLFVTDCNALSDAGMDYAIDQDEFGRWWIAVEDGTFDAAIALCEARA